MEGEVFFFFHVFHKLNLANVNSVPLAAVQEEEHFFFGVYHSIVTVFP